MNIRTRRLRRLSAASAVGAVITGGLTMGLPSAAHAADEVPVYSHTIDLSETRATGHNEFRLDGSGVRVWTEGNTSTDKAAGYFDAHKSLASVGEPSMSWTPNGTNTNIPGMQLKVDFDDNGTIDGTLVGEPSYPNGSVLYGNDWWLTNGSAQFVKDAAPSHSGGFGSDNHGTLAQWRAAFANADVIQAGWSLGSGIKGDGVIQAMVLGGQPYYFVKSAEPTTSVKYKSDVDLSQTRAKGHNVFREIGGVRVTTDPSDCTDPNPAGGTYCANKAAGYFAAPLALKDAGEPSMDYTRYSGARPSVQLVTDFDNNGTPDAILVGETVYGRDWWVPGSAAQFVKDGAPSHTGGSGSDNHGLLSEWRANFPNAKILQVGWSLGSGVEGDGVINSITVGLTKYTFSGVNRAPVADDKTADVNSGSSVEVTLTATDPDGDALTYSTSTPGATVAGNKLTYTASADAPTGDVNVTYTVKDPSNASDTGTVTIHVTHVNRAPVANDATGNVNSGQSVEVTLSATDADGDALTYSTSAPGASVAGNKLTYTAPADAPTGDVNVAFTVKDPSNASDTGNVVIHVTHVNRAPVASNLAANTTSGGTVTITLAATDADGDAITYSSTDGTVVGNKLTYSAAKDFSGTKVLTYKATDPSNASSNGTVTVTVNKATSSTTLKVSPGKITTKSKHVRASVTVTSAGAVAGGTVDLFDGTTKIGTGVLEADGSVKIAVSSKFSKGKHTITAVFAGTSGAATSQASVVVKVKKKK